jgi:hypothetical protein
MCYSLFEAVSRLKINLAKSELVPVGDVLNVNALVRVLGISGSSLPLKYLGLPMGTLFKLNLFGFQLLRK